MDNKKIIGGIILIILLLGILYIIPKRSNDTVMVVNNDVNINNEVISDNQNLITKENDDEISGDLLAQMDAVIVSVQEKESSILVMRKNDKELIYVSVGKDEISKYKINQEIMIHWDGMVLTSYPGVISGKSKIEILKEESDIEIPNNINRYLYSKVDNVSINITNFSQDGLEFEETERNAYSYGNFNKYSISKHEKNEEYTGKGEYFGENTGNSTQGYTGAGLEYVWNELTFKDANKLSLSIKNDVIQNEENLLIKKYKINWDDNYDLSETGEYLINLSTDTELNMSIYFSVDENQNITYQTPEITAY